MPLPNLLFSTRRLRSDIETQSLQFEQDCQRIKNCSVQMRETALARITSPLGLISATVAGFAAGKIATRSKSAEQLSEKAINNVTSAVWDNVRSIALQVILPMIGAWLQSKFANSAPSDQADQPAEPNQS